MVVVPSIFLMHLFSMSLKHKVQESCCCFGCKSVLFPKEFGQLKGKEKI